MADTKPTDTPEFMRRKARALLKQAREGNANALARVRAHVPDEGTLQLAQVLHALAREAGQDSWPKLTFDHETSRMDRAAKAERLRRALYAGQSWAAIALLDADPDLAKADMGILCALYDVEAVQARLDKDPGAATRSIGPRVPILHLTYSRHWQDGGSEADMIRTAEALVNAGADVNASFAFEQGGTHNLSALYGAIGHSRNMRMARWLLEHGADPNDNESLYHATELDSHEGLRMLIEHGAKPAGTNALPRALDFDDYEAARLLLEAGADPNEGITPHPSGAPSLVIPALHQAARRLCSGRIARLLLDHGADASVTARGHTPYAFARIFGNREVSLVLEEAGGSTALSPVEAQLVRAATGPVAPNDWIDMAKLSTEMRFLMTRLVWREDTLPHIDRLVAMGFDPNQPDEMGMPPLHLAGWEGMPEKTAYFLSQQPDLSHINAYGGTFFSTILHGSENCPQRAERDHLGCMRLALEHGVALPKPAIAGAGVPEMAAFLAGWAEKHPGQAVEEGVW